MTEDWRTNGEPPPIGHNGGPEWDYSSEYCDGCAELGLTTCSCEPDGFEEEDDWNECPCDLCSDD